MISKYSGYPLVAIPGQEFVDTSGWYVLLIAALVITTLLYLEGPRITRRTILSLVPWMIAASTIPILGSLTSYPVVVRPLVNSTGAFLSTYLILGSAWFAMIELTVEPETEGVLPDYLGSMGIGLATVTITLVILQGNPSSIDQLGWTVLILFGVIVFAIAVVFLLGFWYVEAPTHTGAVGMLAVFGQTLDGLTRALGIEFFQTVSHSFLSWHVLDIVATVQTTASSNELMISWTMTYVWIKVAIGVLGVILLANYTKRNPDRGYLALGIIATLGVTAGMTNLLLIAIGGLS